MRPTPEDSRQPFRSAPIRRTAAEMHCLLLTFIFHDENNHVRKLATLLVVGVWVALEVGAAYGVATLPDQFTFLRLVVGVLVGRMWGIEIKNFAGVEFGYHERDEGDDGNGGTD